MLNKKQCISYKIFFALLGFAAVVTEISTLVERGTFNPVNFFSFFTIESNLLAVVALLVSAISVAANYSSKKLDFFRGATTLYMVTTGIIFSVLLAGIENATLTAVPWDNIVLHYIMPIVLAVDWILDRPKAVIQFRTACLWLLFPLVYFAYSIIRGSITGWYPYPFLNADMNGYGKLSVTSLALVVFLLVLIKIVTLVPARKLSSKR